MGEGVSEGASESTLAHHELLYVGCIQETARPMLRPVDHIVHFGVLVAAGADLHYLRAADATLNVAHGCALLLGVGLEHQYARLFKKLPAPEPEPEPEPAKRRKHHPREYVIVDESVELP